MEELNGNAGKTRTRAEIQERSRPRKLRSSEEALPKVPLHDLHGFANRRQIHSFVPTKEQIQINREPDGEVGPPCHDIGRQKWPNQIS